MIAVAITVFAPRLSVAQAVSPADRDALVRLYVDRGGRDADLDIVLRRIDEAAAKSLLTAPLLNKVREGVVKGYKSDRIDIVVQQMVANLDAADGLLRELNPAAAGAEREASMALLAESLGAGVTADDVRELVRNARTPAISPERLSAAAKALSFVREAKLPAADGTAVVAEAVHQGYRAFEMLDLGRAIKLRQDDYREGRASLRALRDAIARGERPDQLFRDSRADAASRQTPTRPETPATRPERPARPETPQRAQPPERPTRPGRIAGL